MTLNTFFTSNYKNILDISKNISGGAEWHRDATHMIIQEVYEMYEKPKWKKTFDNLLITGKMMSFINTMINTQYKSKSSNVWRNLRRPLEFDEQQNFKIINYMYDINNDNGDERDKRINQIKIYLNLFNPIDVIIYKDYLLNDKTIKEILEDWNISRKYFYNTISLINRGIKFYIQYRVEKENDLIKKGCDIVNSMKSKPTRVVKMELVVIYNLVNRDKIDNYDNDILFKKVKDFFMNQPFSIKYKNNK